MPYKSYKFRIYPNAEQRDLLARTFGCARFVYNYMLEKRVKLYRESKTTLTYAMSTKELAEMKKTEQYSFLKGIDSIALQQSLRHLDTAFQNFFNQPQNGFPKFKSKKSNKNSYTTLCVNGNIRVSDGHIRLPKIGTVKMKQHRDIPSDYEVRQVTVSQTLSGNYYASIIFEHEDLVQKTELCSFVGLVFSMTGLYTDSNGNEPNYPMSYRKTQKKLQTEQRKLSLMQKSSNNSEKQRIKVAKLRDKIANQRKDFLHKQSRQITNAYDCVCVEDLDIREMNRTLNQGKTVSCGWSEFVMFLSYKLEEQGKKLIKIAKCDQDRGVNAAVKIRNEGMQIAFA